MESDKRKRTFSLAIVSLLFFSERKRIYIAQYTVQTLLTTKTLEIKGITKEPQPGSQDFTGELRRLPQLRAKLEKQRTTKPVRNPPGKAEEQCQTLNSETPQHSTA
jgi:hypothetical protein